MCLLYVSPLHQNHVYISLVQFSPITKLLRLKRVNTTRRGLLHIFWVRGRAIGKSINFRNFGIRNGIDFFNFGIENGIDFRNFGMRHLLISKNRGNETLIR